MNRRSRLLICTIALTVFGPLVGCRHLKVTPHEGCIEFEILTIKNPQTRPRPREVAFVGYVRQKGNTNIPAYLAVYQVYPGELLDTLGELSATIVTSGDAFLPVMDEMRY